MGINTDKPPFPIIISSDNDPLHVYVKSYIERYDNMGLTNIPNNKIIFKVQYGFNRLKFLYDRNIFRLSVQRLTVDINELPLILNFNSKQMNDYLIDALSLTNSYIHSFVIRHTIGGLDERIDVTFTNSESKFPLPKIQTMSEVDLMEKLPSCLTKNMSKESYPDMFGVHHYYTINDDYMKIVNYLKLVNYYDNDDLKYSTLLIIPRTHLWYYPLP